jgi:alcohol dehydrogenase class IV
MQLKFTFQTTKSVLAEAGASCRIGELARSLGCRSVLLVSDKGVVEAGLLTLAIESLNTHNVGIVLFTDVVADPPEHIVLAAVEAAQCAHVDGVVAIGGGSSMDVAKLVSLLAARGELLDDVFGVGNAKGPRLPLILAPTTAGTGSEVTPISIVTTADGEKKGVVSPVLLPDWAVLDADLTIGLPPAVSAATGIDAMVHALEAYTSKHSKNPLSDCLAREALKLLSGNIREVCQNSGNREARQAMLLGSMLAGMAFANAPVAAVHALAYPIGARFHVAHGLSNSLVLAEVMRFNSLAAAPLYADLASIIIPEFGGDERSRANGLIRYFADLTSELALPTRLRDVGIRQEDISQLAEDAMKQTRLLVNNPRELALADAYQIYEAVL